MTAKIKKSAKTSAKATKSASLVKTKTPVKTKLVEQSASQTLTPAVSVKKPEPKVQTRYIFIRNEKSNPAIGVVGQLEEVEEESIEIVMEESILRLAIQKLKEVHPYEEPAYEVYKLEDF